MKLFMAASNISPLVFFHSKSDCSITLKRQHTLLMFYNTLSELYGRNIFHINTTTIIRNAIAAAKIKFSHAFLTRNYVIIAGLLLPCFINAVTTKLLTRYIAPDLTIIHASSRYLPLALSSLMTYCITMQRTVAYLTAFLFYYVFLFLIFGIL